MSPTSQKTFTFVIPVEMKAALQAIREREGIPESEQIRRGIQMWIDSKGVQPTAPTTRRRSEQARSQGRGR